MSIDAKEDVKMKCDELKYENLGDMMPFYPRSTLVIRKQFVDAAIAELKEVYKDSVDVKVKIWERYKKAEDELRKTQRALWLTRAERAYVTTLLWNVYCYQNNCLYFRDFMNEKCNPFRDLPKKTAMEWSDLWESIETKCRAKAEEYE